MAFDSVKTKLKKVQLNKYHVKIWGLLRLKYDKKLWRQYIDLDQPTTHK